MRATRATTAGTLFIASDNASLAGDGKELPGPMRGWAVEGPRRSPSELPHQHPTLQAFASAPSTHYFSRSPQLRRGWALAALEDLLLLAEADLLVGTASSHFGAVAAALRFAVGAAPVAFADEEAVAAGAHAVGLMHSSNLHRGATPSEKRARWEMAARRLLESADAAAAPATARCDELVRGRGLVWRHSPPAPCCTRRELFGCVLHRLLSPCATEPANLSAW